MLIFTNHTFLNPELSFKGKVIKPAHLCRYLGVEIYSNLTFENHLKSVLSKTANAIRSFHVVSNQIPLKVGYIFFKSVVLSHLFSVEYSFKLFSKNMNSINKQINWGNKIVIFFGKLSTPLIF